MKRLRCCGRFCYWRPPIGPWCCTSCPRTFDGPMPAAAVGRFWDWIDDLVAKVPEWTEAQRALARRCFPGRWSTLPIATAPKIGDRSAP